jgi:hypothetical protein
MLSFARAPAITSTDGSLAMTAKLATATASARLSNEPGRALLTVRGQHGVTDSPPTLGGPNEAANPVELLLSALAGCAVFVCERAAQELGIDLQAVKVTAAGEFDPRGVCGEDFRPTLPELQGPAFARRSGCRAECAAAAGLQDPLPGVCDAVARSRRWRSCWPDAAWTLAVTAP